MNLFEIVVKLNISIFPNPFPGKGNELDAQNKAQDFHNVPSIPCSIGSERISPTVLFHKHRDSDVMSEIIAGLNSDIATKFRII